MRTLREALWSMLMTFSMTTIAWARGDRRLATVGADGALFRGNAANCLREGVFTAVYLGAYDACRVALSGGGDRPPTRVVAAVAATTGALAWVANYPFDTVKSVQQSAPPSAPRAGLARAVRTLWRRGGVGAFYAGLAPSTARAVLVTTSRLVAYEHVRGWFDAPR